ncbi:two component transcriptional regulator, winged helix family protein [Alkalihalophilus pseudofirmus OF4]|uniref:Two component transcriptional regulator, winged helix family protein n=1 Tax=Alkalihalophilus pseudofirmus (strain ATCC BAA-2126 / JCM 17055 / OF4) TaxID=398511 RepID=D3FTJ5_ALKPO|nr:MULTISPECIES: response regulator transcription factor [Alkalihalophilus]ADC50068.1 two component transcriptional regulator, winged helix family protein [Alkalihalophilus pseudofirmus OF4]MED1599818.1 response regulator transcription factor [Alkalihalophilus marmarensis]
MKHKALSVLIIEDDPHIAELIQLYMEKLGYLTQVAYDGEAGLESYYETYPDFIFLDIMLPKIDGWELCQEIRWDNKKIPIIMLTGKGESQDKIKGLDIGADDYVVKPFDPNELVARMKAVMRRADLLNDEDQVVSLLGLVVDKKEYKAAAGDKEITMPPKELDLLYYLASYPNQVFTRQQLLDQIWGYAFEGDPRTIDVHIKRIREKLTEADAKWTIKTIRGVGYKFLEKEHE